jgi:hypothetical protein
MARSDRGVTDTLSNITDDTKDFVDDEIIDRGRDTERDLRRAGRNWTHSEDDRRGGRSRQSIDTNELRTAINELSKKVDDLGKN